MSFGVSLSVYRFEIDSVFKRYLPGGGFTGPADLTDEQGRASQQGRDHAFAPAAGVLVNRGPMRIGVIYRRGASFTYTTQDGSQPERRPTFRVPHTLALGASFRMAAWPRPAAANIATPQLTLAFEVTRVDYSRLREDFVVDQTVGTGRTDSFSVKDGTEIHIGGHMLCRG